MDFKMLQSVSLSFTFILLSLSSSFGQLSPSLALFRISTMANSRIRFSSTLRLQSRTSSSRKLYCGYWGAEEMDDYFKNIQASTGIPVFPLNGQISSRP